MVRLNNTSVAETFLLPVEVKNSSHQSLEDCAFVIVFIPFHHRLQIKSNVTITSINNTRSSSPNSTTHNTAISLTKRHSSITDSLIPYSSHNHANPLRVSFPSLYNALDIIQFFNSNKHKLLVNCTDNREFSHCQQYYLFQVHKDDKQCSNFAPTPCTPLPHSLTTRHSSQIIHWSHAC